MLTPNVNLENKTLLVTGAAGFIGANLVMELLRTVKGVKILGLDNMSDYYDEGQYCRQSAAGRPFCGA